MWWKRLTFKTSWWSWRTKERLKLCLESWTWFVTCSWSGIHNLLFLFLLEKALNQCISVGYVYDKYADICYKIYHFNVTWESANNFCRDQGGRLLILDNRKKFDRIEKILSSGNFKFKLQFKCILYWFHLFVPHNSKCEWN